MKSKSQNVQFDFEYYFKLIPDFICVSGYDGYFKKVNPAALNILGYSEEELLSAPVYSFVHPEDRELTSKKFECLRNGEVLLRFESRYLTKGGKIVWLLWTSVPIERDRVVFSIAKDITLLKEARDLHIGTILEKLNTDQMQRFEADINFIRPAMAVDSSNLKWMGNVLPISQRDQVWLNRLEAVVRKHVGRLEVNLAMLSSDMAISERQLFRQVKRIMGVTPSKLVQTIRFHLAWEAIASGKYHSLAEIARIAGYTSKTHFKKVFNTIYGIDIAELL